MRQGICHPFVSILQNKSFSGYNVTNVFMFTLIKVIGEYSIIIV